jgi:hypothetical protein
MATMSNTLLDLNLLRGLSINTYVGLRPPKQHFNHVYKTVRKTHTS